MAADTSSIGGTGSCMNSGAGRSGEDVIATARPRPYAANIRRWPKPWLQRAAMPAAGIELAQVLRQA